MKRKRSSLYYQDIRDAALNCNGDATLMASILGVRRETVYGYLLRYREIKEIYQAQKPVKDAKNVSG